MKKEYPICLFIACSLLTYSPAFSAFDIGAPTTGPFAKLGSWFQQYVDFIDGPFGKAVVIIALVIATAIWMFAPKEGMTSMALRIVVGGFVIFNVSAIIASF